MAQEPHINKKRKRQSQNGGSSQGSSQPHRSLSDTRKRRRPNMQDARKIAAQTTAQAFGNPQPNGNAQTSAPSSAALHSNSSSLKPGAEAGQLNVDKFVRAREFEIKALEQGMRNARGALNQRAFQGVPKDLRRRTASHDVKRVPKRLRARAKREMADDNTPGMAERKKKKRRERKAQGWLRIEGKNAMRNMIRLAESEFGIQSKESASKPANKDASEKPASDKIAKDDSDVQMKDAEKDGAQNSTSKKRRKPKTRDGVLQKAVIFQTKYRKRQVHKMWLPTHLYHAKRAHMPPPKEPLWRMAIPLSPTEKSYRPTHRAGRSRGALAWDMSYMSTMSVHGSEAAILNVYAALGVDLAQDSAKQSAKARRWISGSRFWQGWIRRPAAEAENRNAPVTIIWNTGSENGSTHKADMDVAGRQARLRTSFIRTHPSAFLETWQDLLELCKQQTPAVKIEDLRFEIGGIDVTGPAAAEALVGTLWPSKSTDVVEKVWSRLKWVTDATSMPENAMLGMSVSDPRLHHPPRKHAIEADATKPTRELMELLTNWPADKTQEKSGLFDRKSRWAAGRQLPSQKAVNRRKALAAPGKYPEAVSTDPAIPVVVLACREGSGSPGTWTVLLPWKCVLPVWYSLMYFPLSTGGTPRLAGLDQKRQLLFETGQAWYPGDYAGTQSGQAWEMSERGRRQRAWERRPKGKRVEYDSVDLGLGRRGELGRGWACDWQYLFAGGSEVPVDGTGVCQISLGAATRAMEGQTSEAIYPHALATVRITLLTRGVPSVCGRVYRLPSQDAGQREQWMQLMAIARTGGDRARPVKMPADLASHAKRRILAAALLEPPLPRTGDAAYPAVPGAEDLIGFITTGNFNLSEGKGTGIANIAVAKVVEQRKGATGPLSHTERLCIVRDSGQGIGRLAVWELC